MEGNLKIRPEGRVYFLYQGKPFDPSIMQVHTSTRTSARYPMSKRESLWVVKHGMIKGGANSKQDTQSQWISTLGFTQDTHRVVVLVEGDAVVLARGLALVIDNYNKIKQTGMTSLPRPV